jgi:hypothetical protein
LVHYLGRASNDHVGGIASHAFSFLLEVVVPIDHLHKCVEGFYVRSAVQTVDSTLYGVEYELQVPTD